MDTPEELRHVSLCAGYAGIDLGLKRAVPNLRTVAFCEIEAYACANLVAKMEQGLLDAAPIWTNLKTFPWGAFRGRVGLLSGGYPCQPFSTAGKRLGAEDPRHLWPYIAGGIAIMRPSVCFFENVEGHVTLGLREVIGELGSLGYRTTWGIFSAGECGAPHRRKRVFILAHTNDALSKGTRLACGGNTELPLSHPSREAWRRDPADEAEPRLGRMADGRPDTVDRLRLLGNGVVPATAELAFRTLMTEIIQGTDLL